MHDCSNQIDVCVNKLPRMKEGRRGSPLRSRGRKIRWERSGLIIERRHYFYALNCIFQGKQPRIYLSSSVLVRNFYSSLAEQLLFHLEIRIRRGLKHEQRGGRKARKVLRINYAPPYLLRTYTAERSKTGL